MSAALPNFNEGPLAVGQLRYQLRSRTDASDYLVDTLRVLMFMYMGREDARRELIEALDSVGSQATAVLPLSKSCTAKLYVFRGIVHVMYLMEALTWYRLPCSAEARRFLCLTQGSQASLASCVRCPCSKSTGSSSKQKPLPSHFEIEAECFLHAQGSSELTFHRAGCCTSHQMP